MLVLMALVPFYLFIASAIRDRPLHAPTLALDHVLPLQPAWSLVYGALYAFLIVLPVFVVRQDDHIRRTFLAYLMVWIAAYICFWVYPTIAPRPTNVTGTGFFAWGLRSLYGADPPYNCFPSLHVAHSFVSAFTCSRVNRNVGVVAIISRHSWVFPRCSQSNTTFSTLLLVCSWRAWLTSCSCVAISVREFPSSNGVSRQFSRFVLSALSRLEWPASGLLTS